jgi:uncharacterized protein YciI
MPRGPAHLEHLRRSSTMARWSPPARGGPGDARGGLLVFHASDRAAVQAIVDSDPFVVPGVVARCDIREWVPLLGPAASLLASRR